MKKKISQWFIGLMVALIGFCICLVGIDAVFSFIDMLNTTGAKCAGYFFRFLFMLLLFAFTPWLLFKEIADGVQDKFK